MNKGNQKKTIEKYINYLADLIKLHNLKHLKSVNLKDNELLRKYFKGNDATIQSAYSYMIKKLLSLGIISNTNGQFIPNVKSRQYEINLEELMKYKDIDIPDIDFIDSLFPFRNTKSKVVEISSLNSICSTPLSFNDIKVDDNLLKKIDNKGVIDLEPFKVKNENITGEALQDVTDYYALKIKYNNPVYKECLNIIKWLNENQNICEYSMPLHAEINTKNVYTSIKISMRQYNHFARYNKETRNVVLKAKNLDLNYDLHSAIFAVARLLNYDEFDIDWDIKRIIFDEYDTLKDAEREELKILLNRCFFTKSSGQAWTKYHYIFKDSKNEVSKEMFFKIYDLVQNLTYGTSPYMYNIFLYESLFELLILKQLISKGYEVANVYDCFYFSSSQTTIEEVKNVITEVAINFNNYISLLS